jgi:hypothetical protein
MGLLVRVLALVMEQALARVPELALVLALVMEPVLGLAWVQVRVLVRMDRRPPNRA